jgi:peptidyl-prolyl cis-trans isomerase A (cyclophilin A)
MSRAIFALGLLMVCAMRLSLESTASDLKVSDSKAPANSKPVQVAMHTELGDIEIEVDTARAPVTAENFLRYVDRGFYDGAAFYRTVTMQNQPQNKVKIEVVQGGSPRRESEDLPPIPLERTSKTGLKHVDGAISMARDQPDSATSEFFICIGDQPELDFGGKRNPDGQGFAAFGHVVKGMEVVRKIQASPANGQSLTPPIKIMSAKRL